MLFNSVDFAIFFPLVFILYWSFFSKKESSRSLFLLAVSYLFYGLWDWRFLFLVAGSSVIDFVIGKKIHAEQDKGRAKKLLLISVFVNLGVLSFFKYYNFFLDSFVDSFSFFGMPLSISRLNIILPVGISFYTFQTLSYTIDVYRKQIKPTENALNFFAFVSFFPQLVAGPIERAKDLLPQFSTPKIAKYKNFQSGGLLILWGLFIKIVIADRLAIYVDAAHLNIDGFSGLPLLIGVLFFAFQLYIDFSAYSSIAIGVARMLGFELSTNFNKPYIAHSFSNFWERWHISLSSWFRDYLFIPLGGSKVNKGKVIRNIAIVFVVSGLWHGASWNFVMWGLLNALFLIALNPILKSLGAGVVGKMLSRLVVFTLWALSLIFFRAKTFTGAVSYFKNLSFKNSDLIYDLGLNEIQFQIAIGSILGLVLIELLHEKKKTILDVFYKGNFLFRWVVYLFLLLGILFFGSYGVGLNDQNFIYFQF